MAKPTVRIAAAIVISAVIAAALSRCEAVPDVRRSEVWIDTVRRETTSIRLRGPGMLVPATARASAMPIRQPERPGRKVAGSVAVEPDSLPLKASMRFSKDEAGLLEAGQHAEVVVHGVSVVGRVERVDRDRRNGDVFIDVRLPEELPPGARPNLSVTIAIDVQSPEALVVARPALDAGPGKFVVFRLTPEGRAAERVVISAGRITLDTIEVTSGLAAGDRVIVSDLPGLERHERILLRD